MRKLAEGKSSIQLSNLNKKVIIITCLFMVISLYAPYIRAFTYIYQIAVLTFIFLVARKNIGSCIVPLVLLTVTRDYIAASISASFSSSYGINGRILVGIMLIIIFLFLYKRHYKIDSTKSSLMMLLFGLQMMLSQFFAVSLEEYGEFFCGICLMYMIFPYIIDSDEDIIISRLTFAIAGFFMAIGILPYILNYTDLSAYTTFINGNSLLVDRNYQSLFIMLCVLQTIVFLIENGNTLAWIIKIAVVVIIIADVAIVVAGGSRSAIITTIAAIIIYLIINKKNISKSLVFLLIVGLVGIIAFQMGLFDVVIERFHASDVSSGNGRFDIWERFIVSYCDGNIISWLFGRGLVGRVYTDNAAHNVYISILFCFGIVGIILYLGNIFITIHNCIKTKHANELIVLVPILIMCCTLEPYYRIECAIYIPLVSSTAVYYLRRKRYEI